MPGQTEMPGGRLARRLDHLLRDHRRNRGGGRGIRGQQGRQREGPAGDRRRLHAVGGEPCIGPVPKPAGGIPLPATAPTQVAAAGPSFNVLQSGQFVNFTNNQSTLGGQLRLDENAPRQQPSADRDPELRVRRQVAEPQRDRDSGRQGVDRRHARRAPVRRQLHQLPARRRARPRRGPRRTSRARTRCPRPRPASAARSRSTAPARSPSSTPRATRYSGPSPTRARPPACSATSSASKAAPLA